MHPANTYIDKFGEDSSGCRKPPLEPPPGSTYHVGPAIQQGTRRIAMISSTEKGHTRIHSGRQPDSRNSITGSGRKMNASLLWTQSLATLGAARRVDKRSTDRQELHARQYGIEKMGHDIGTLDDDLNFGRTIRIEIRGQAIRILDGPWMHHRGLGRTSKVRKAERSKQWQCAASVIIGNHRNTKTTPNDASLGTKRCHRCAGRRQQTYIGLGYECCHGPAAADGATTIPEPTPKHK